MSMRKLEGSKRRLSTAWISITCLLLLVFFGTAIFFSWAVKHAIYGGKYLSPYQAKFIISISEFPATLISTTKQFPHNMREGPWPLLLGKSSTEGPQWVRHFPDIGDNGYLLFSGLDSTKGVSSVKLIRISDGKVIWRWLPDWNLISKLTTDKAYGHSPTPAEARAVHPLLLDNGDIVFNTWASLVKLSPCKSEPTWLIDKAFHHSNEIDTKGTGVWTPTVSSDGFKTFGRLKDRIRDDAIGHVSLSGHIIDNRSFARILLRNGLHGILLGTTGTTINTDPIHLNEIKEASYGGKYWEKGDLLISSRHLSTLFIYRPSTDRILWHMTGPWLNQHSADFVNDHQISVFDNRVLGYEKMGDNFFGSESFNRVLIFDFSLNRVIQPFSEALAKARPHTITEGRAQILGDGGLFFEETNNGRLMRFNAKQELMWSFINDYDSSHIGTLSWSRYLSEKEAKNPISALTKLQCAH